MFDYKCGLYFLCMLYFLWDVVMFVCLICVLEVYVIMCVCFLVDVFIGEEGFCFVEDQM